MRFALLSRTFPALLAAAVFGAVLPASARDGGRHDRGDHHEARDEHWDDRHDRRYSHWDDRHDRRYSHWDDRHDRRYSRWDDRHDRRYSRWDDRHDRRHDRRRGVYVVTSPRVIYHPPRVVHVRPGHRPPPRWSRGYRIHDYGWAPTYVVVDYGRHGLWHPPRGHHWRRDDRGNWLLVAIATGIVADAILND